jgi:hypothetical protein
MKRWRYAIPFFAVAFAAACSTDTVTPPDSLRSAPGLRFDISGAVNTDFYNVGDGTCSNINSNIYPDQFTVGLDGNPSTIGAGSYWVRVEEPDGDILGTSPSANFVVDGGTTCYQVWDLVNKQSDGSQGFDETTNNGGEYRLLVSETADFVASAATKSDNFKVRVFTNPSCEETNTCPSADAVFTAEKFYDLNLNGAYDPGLGEVLISGWHLSATLGAATSEEITTFTTTVLAGTSYDVTELKPSTGTWIPTSPINLTGSVPSGGATIYFGNVCLAGGGGLTLGFWSNKNGQNSMGDGGSVQPELDMLNALPLANATGNQLNFTGYSSGAQPFRSWILNATAINMAYMLSAQLAAMELNVEGGFVSGTALVYAPAVTGSSTLGFISINDLMAAAVTALSDQYTPAGDPNRAEQEDIKNALDAANNNLNFLSATPCSLTGATWSAWPTL